MKNFMAIMLCFYGMSTAFCQYLNSDYYYFPTGHAIKNLTLFEVNGNTTYLYDRLDEGKPIVIFRSHNIDTIGWNYHNSGVLQNFYNLHGPNGDNQANVFFFGDLTDIIWGDTGMGNWLANLPYESYETMGTTAPLWKQGAYMYRVCPDRRAYELEFGDEAYLLEQIQQCETSTEVNDAQIVDSDIDTSGSCLNEIRPVNAYLSNMGSEPLTSADILVKVNGALRSTYHWTGNLPTYHLDTIALDDLLTDGFQNTVEILTANPNGTQDTRPTNDASVFQLSKQRYWDSDTIKVFIHNNKAAHVLYWEIATEDGNILRWGGSQSCSDGFCSSASSYYSPFPYDIRDSVSIADYPATCLRIKVVSGKGYGLWWPNFPSTEIGYIRFLKNEEVFYEWSDFGLLASGKIFTTFHLSPFSFSAATTTEIDNNADGSIILTATGGQAPYQYSLDCGQTYVSSNEFTGLEAGIYCVAVMDSIGQVMIDSVEVGQTVGTAALIYGRAFLSVQPNPAQDVLQIQLSGAPMTATATEATLFDLTGRRVATYRLQRQGNVFGATISVAELPAGVYVLRSPYAAAVKVQKWF